MYLGEAMRELRYVARPDFRSAIRASSTHALGMKVVVRRRLGGRGKVSPILCLRVTN